MIDALNADVDWLLVAGTPKIEDLVLTVVAATDDGSLSTGRLHDAACAVRKLANDIGLATRLLRPYLAIWTRHPEAWSIAEAPSSVWSTAIQACCGSHATMLT